MTSPNAIADTDEAPTSSHLLIVDATAPPQRRAAFRIAAGVFTLGYLIIRLPVFHALADRSAPDFDPVGIAGVLDRPVPSAVLRLVVVVTIVAGAASIAGLRYRIAAPAFAIGMLVLATYRSSWGQLLHFEHLMVLHLLVLALAPAADAWSLDARRNEQRTGRQLGHEPDVRYGWPLALAGLVTVITYVIAGIAKLRYGGLDWIAGDTLTNHVAYSAARLDLIGGSPPLFAESAVRLSWALPVFAAVAVLIELPAPIAFLGGRVRTAWCVAAWSMHIGIFLTMSVGFPSPIFGLAFAPFFALERPVEFVRDRRSRRSA